jgi:hypothetical protein
MVGREKVDMRSSSFARVVIAGLAVSLSVSLGCGKPPTEPSEMQTPTPGIPPSWTSERAALALLEVASLHAGVTTSPLTWATEADGKVRWTNGPCEFPAQGSLQGSLDGGVPPTSGMFLPTGSHTYVVSFSNCLVDGWAGTLTGVASAAYSAAEWSNVTAKVSADAVRGWHEDIYVSQRATRDDAWGPAVNLGSTINTPTNESVPAFAQMVLETQTSI